MNVNIIDTAKINIDRPRPPVAGGVKEKSQKTSDAPDTSNASENKAPVTRAELDKAIESANDIGALLKRKLSFTVDEATERLVVHVIDKETGETVRQVPPKEMLRISAHLKQLQDMNDQVMSAVKSVILDMKS